MLAAPLALALPRPAAAAAKKVLKLAFRGAETSFDPAKISDLYSRVITGTIFEAPYGYDHLARPVKVIPVLADGMPEVSDDFRVWTIRLKRGVYFSDDPAFKGQRRELTGEASCTRSSGWWTRPTRARARRACSRTASSAWPRCARRRSTAASPSTTTRRCRA